MTSLNKNKIEKLNLMLILVLAILILPLVFGVGNGRKIKTDITNENYFEVSFADENFNGLIDTIYWITPHTSEQEFEVEVIKITKAAHLDADYSFISDIFDEVIEKDNIWSEPIFENEFVRVTFERNLTSSNDITVYTRNTQGLNTYIEVYLADSTEKITEFPYLIEEGYHKIFLTGMQGTHSTFDLKIVNNDEENAYLEFDHIVDPPCNLVDDSVIIYGDGNFNTTEQFNVSAQFTCPSEGQIRTAGFDISLDYGANTSSASSEATTNLTSNCTSTADFKFISAEFTRSCDDLANISCTDANSDGTITIDITNDPVTAIINWTVQVCAGTKTRSYDFDVKATSITDGSITFNNWNETGINNTDLTKPRINAAIFNVSAPTKGDVVNFTANATDNGLLDTCQFFMNGTSNGAFIILNKTITGNDSQCSQNWTIDLIRGNVINFTALVNDTNNNKNQSEQIVTVANFIPIPSIVFPTNDLKTNQQPLHMNVTYEADRDNDVINISYYINGRLNQTQIKLNTTFNASDGIYILNVSLFDNVTATSYSSNVTVNFTIDTVKPNVTLNAPVNIFNTSNVNVTFNFTATDNIATSLNCSLYINGTINQTNTSTLNGTATLFIVNNIAENSYKWNVTCLDAALNSNTSERNFTIDITLPSINQISFSPNSTADVDPNVLLNFTINTTDNGSAVKTVVLQYKQSGAGTFTNTTAQFDSTAGLYYANFTPDIADTWNYKIYTEDFAANNDTSDIQNISVQNERTWKRTPSLFDTISCGFSNTCVVGNLTINNTGDFTLNFDLSTNFADTAFNDTEPFDLAAKTYKVVRISLTAGITASESNVVTTIDATTSNADPDSDTTNMTFVASAGGPVFDVSIATAPVEVNRSKREAFNLSSKIKNIGNQSATDIWVNWTLPANWYNLSGNLSKSFSSIAVSETVYHNITVNLTSDATTGTKTVIVNATANTNTTKGSSVNIIVTETGVVTVVTVTVGGGGGGGSGGGGGGGGGVVATPEKKIETEAIYELVRGKDQSFTLPINNSFDIVMKNITASVTGFLSQYIEITGIPSEIAPNGSANLTIHIKAPRYFTKGDWILNFTINGLITKKTVQIDETEKTESSITEIIHFSEKRAVLLAIHELSREDAAELINLNFDEIKKLEMLNLSAKKLRKLIADSEVKLKARDYEGVQELHDTIKDEVEKALQIYNKIKEFNVKVAEAAQRKIETSGTQRLILLAKSALDREDYNSAFARLKEIELTFALETKGVFSVVDFIKNNPGLVSFIVFYLLLFAISVYFKIKITRMNYELRNLAKEKDVLRGLMETAQRECFEKKTIDMSTYNTTMLQYENRLINVVQRIIELESLKASLVRPALHRLELERIRLLDLLKQTQDEYIVKGLQETGVYKSKIHSYSTKLSEVEGKIIVKESEATIRKEKRMKFLRSLGIGKKSTEEPKEEVQKISISGRLDLIVNDLTKMKEGIKQHILQYLSALKKKEITEKIETKEKVQPEKADLTPRLAELKKKRKAIVENLKSKKKLFQKLRAKRIRREEQRRKKYELLRKMSEKKKELGYITSKEIEAAKEPKIIKEIEIRNNGRIKKILKAK